MSFITRLKQFSIILLILFVLSPAVSSAEGVHGDYDNSRALLLSYILRQQLPFNHYSHKAIDDDLSRAAFDLYLKQLDSQKRFLLQSDVEKLQAYSTRIDDEINLGRLELPKVAAVIMDERIPQVQAMVREILAGDFDFSTDEKIETDPEKLQFCKTLEELRERWRKTLKFQVETRYLNLLDDQQETPAKSGTAPGATKKASNDLLVKAREKVSKSYEDFFSRMLKEKIQDQYDQYFNAVARAFDPHTNYFPPETKEDFDIHMRGSLEGIGATLREEDGYTKVVTIIPGSAASRQGQLQAEDIILMVAEGKGEPVDVTDMPLRDVVKLIRGKKGTEVRLTVKKPDGKRLIIPIVRDVVQIEETFVKSTVLTDRKSGKTYGFIQVPSFYRDFKETMDGGKGRNATDDVRTELEKLKAKKIDGLILDLRNDGGGALTDAVSIAGLFIKSGPVVQVKDSRGSVEVLNDDDPSISYSGPMVVLVNEFSASASEILAAAMQDYGRAIVIGGQHTHGKGTVQTIIDLDRAIPFSNMEKYSPLGALKITIQKFYRVTGESTQYRGVIPDIVLPDELRYLKTGEKYLEYSLPWDTVGPTKFARWPQAAKDLSRIKEESSQRVQSDPEFVAIREEAGLAKERSEQTLQSLNIDELRKERQETKELEAKAGGTAHGRPGALPAAKKDEAKASPGEKLRLWTEGLYKDPYTEEAMGVLADVAAGEGGNRKGVGGSSQPTASR
jgi:carboxyl-terminal processing protease